MRGWSGLEGGMGWGGLGGSVERVEWVGKVGWSGRGGG